MLSDARIEEIEKRQARQERCSPPGTERELFLGDIDDLLADVDRLKARLAAAEKVCEKTGKMLLADDFYPSSIRVRDATRSVKETWGALRTWERLRKANHAE